MEYIYKSSRPRMTVESTGGKKLGHCYTASFFTVTTTYPLSDHEITGLFQSGAVGYGQIHQLVSTETFEEMVPCIGIDGDKVIENPLNPYNGEPYRPINIKHWIYKIETRCDSGD